MDERILETIESKKNDKEALIEYLYELKNRGILTLAEVNSKIEELNGIVESPKSTGKLNTRTPDTMEYAYSNVSAGFTSTGVLGLLTMAAPAIVAMIEMLNK